MLLFRFQLACKTISMVLIFLLLQSSNFALCENITKIKNSNGYGNNCISPKSYFETLNAGANSHALSLSNNLSVGKVKIPVKNITVSKMKYEFFLKTLYLFKNAFSKWFFKKSLHKFLLTVLLSFFIAVSSTNAQDIDLNEITQAPVYSLVDNYRANILTAIEVNGIISANQIESLLHTARFNLDEAIQKEAIKILSENNCLEALNTIIYSNLYSVLVREESFYYLKNNNGIYAVTDFINKYLTDKDITESDYLLLDKRLFDLQDALVADAAVFDNIDAFSVEKKVELLNALFVLYESNRIDSVIKDKILKTLFDSMSNPADIAKFVTSYTDISMVDKSALLLSVSKGQVSFNQHNNLEFRDAAVCHLKAKVALQLLSDLSDKSVPDNFLLRFVFDQNRIRYASFLYTSAKEGRYNEKWTKSLLPDIYEAINQRTVAFLEDVKTYSFGQNSYQLNLSEVAKLRDAQSVNSRNLRDRNEALSQILKLNQRAYLSYLAVNSSFSDIRVKAVNALKYDTFYLMQIQANTKYQDVRDLTRSLLSSMLLNSSQKLTAVSEANINLSSYIVPLIKNSLVQSDKEMFLNQYLKNFSDPFALLEFYNVIDSIAGLTPSDVSLLKSFVENEVRGILALSLLNEKIDNFAQKNANSLFASKDEEIMTIEDIAKVFSSGSINNVNFYLAKVPDIKKNVDVLFADLSQVSILAEAKFSFIGSIKQSMLQKFLLLFGVSFSILLMPFAIGLFMKHKLKAKSKKVFVKNDIANSKAINIAGLKREDYTFDVDISKLNNKESLSKLKDALAKDITFDILKENQILKSLDSVLNISDDIEIIEEARVLYKKFLYRIYQRKTNKERGDVGNDSRSLETVFESKKDSKQESKTNEILTQLKNIFKGEGFISSKMIEQLSQYEGKKFKISSDLISLRKKIKFTSYLLSLAQYGLVVIPFFLSMFFVVPSFFNILLIGFLGFFVGAELLNQWLFQKIEVKDKSLGAVIRKIGLDFKISRANLPSSWHIVTGELSRWYIFQLGLTIFSITAALFFVKITFVPFFIGLVFLSALVVFYSVFSKKGILKKQDAFLTDYQNALNVLEDNVALGIDYDFDELLSSMQKSSKSFRGKSIKFSFRLFLLIKIGIPLIGVVLGYPLQGYLLSTYLYSFFGTNYFIRSVFESLFHVKILKKLLDQIDGFKNITKVKWDSEIQNDKRAKYFEQGWYIDSLKLENFSVPLPGNKEKYIIKNQSIAFERGLLFRISAVSGAGKSTLAKIIASVWDNKGGSGSKILNLKNSEGLEKSVPCTSDYFDLSDIRRSIKYIDMSDFPSGSSLSVLLNRFKISQKSFFDLLAKLIPDLKFQEETILSKNLSQFSHGERLRLELILVLLYYRDKNISHLILDEPFANLDTKSIKTVFAYLQKWQKELSQKDSAGKSPALILIDHNLPSETQGIDKNISFDDGVFVEHSQYQLQESIYQKTLYLIKIKAEDIYDYESFDKNLYDGFLTQYNELLGIPQEETKVVQKQQTANDLAEKEATQYATVTDYISDLGIELSEENLKILQSYSLEDFTANLFLCEKYRLPLNQNNMEIWQREGLFSDDIVLGFSLRNAVNQLLNQGAITASNMLKNTDWIFFYSLFKIDSLKFMDALNFATASSQLARKIIAQMVLMYNKIEKPKLIQPEAVAEKIVHPKNTHKAKIKKSISSRFFFKILPLFFVVLFALTHSNLFLDLSRKIQNGFKNPITLLTNPAEIFNEYNIWNKSDDNSVFADTVKQEDVYSPSMAGFVQDFSLDVIYAGKAGVVNYLIPKNTYVRTGDVIARYSNSEQDRLMKALNMATRKLSLLQNKLRQDKLLLQNNYIASQDVADIQRKTDSAKNEVLLLQKLLERFIIRAYTDGILQYSNDFLQEGYSFVKEEELFRIADDKQKIITFNLPVNNAAFLQKGSAVNLQIGEHEVVGNVFEIGGDLSPYNSELTVSVLLPQTAFLLARDNQYDVRVKINDMQNIKPLIFPFNKYSSLSGFVMPHEDILTQAKSTATGQLRYIYNNNVLVGVNVIDPVLTIQIAEAMQAKDRLKDIWQIQQNLYENTGGVSENQLQGFYTEYQNALDAYNSLIEIKNKSYMAVDTNWEILSNLPPQGKYVSAGEVIFSYKQNKNVATVTAFVKQEDLSIVNVDDSVFVYVEGHNLFKASLGKKGMEQNGYVPFVFDFEQGNSRFPQGLPVQVLVPRNNNDSDSFSQIQNVFTYDTTNTRYEYKADILSRSA